MAARGGAFSMAEKQFQRRIVFNHLVLSDKAHNDLRNRQFTQKSKKKESTNPRTFDDLVPHNENGN